ncbi:MAG: hypothetical protein HYR86_00490 [Candidatus Rokubacteria bacterium]|nr:hypothetical protein [Candidatus Rokubacteria bacterium]
MDQIRVVDYFYAESADRPGEAARVLSALHDAGVNLFVFTGFPRGRRAQLDFVPDDAASFRAAARKAGLKLKGPKKAFLIAGEDRPGAMLDVMRKLGDAKVNVTSTQAVCGGAGRFGAIVWVKARDVKRAAKALGAG